MMIKKLRSMGTAIHVAMICGALVGAGLGSAAQARAQAELVGGFPNQCYSPGGTFSCPYCGGGCLGSAYLCCQQ